MIWLMIFVFCGLVGQFVYQYLCGFAEQLTQEIHQTYCEIFPQNPPRFLPKTSVLKPLKCGKNWQYFLLFAFIGLIISYVIITNHTADSLPVNLAIALLYFCSVTLLFVIAVIDWHYRLISPAACQFLLCLGVVLAYFHIGFISLEQSLQNAMLSFLLFWGLFHLAKWHYQQEAFGRGDYWLIAALSSFLPWQHLPIFILIASLSGLIYGGYLHLKKQLKCGIPFAPFLILGMLVSFAWNMLG